MFRRSMHALCLFHVGGEGNCMGIACHTTLFLAAAVFEGATTILSTTAMVVVELRKARFHDES